MKKIYILFVSLIISSLAISQSITNYQFTTNVDGSFALDLNGNTVDMSTGTTTLINPSISDGSGSGLVNIGFEYWFMGVRNTQFSVSSHGWFGVGTALNNGNSWLGGGTAGNPRLAPFLAATTAQGTTPAMGTSATGKIHYKVIGLAPNRTLVVEYLNMTVNASASAGTVDATFQARIYETSGVVEYVYGPMKVSGSSSIFANIGFSNTSTVYQSVATATHTSSTTTSTNLTFPVGTITALNSPTEGARRYYRWTPPLPLAPSNLTFSNVVAGAMTLNWTDNATDETGYAILRSLDGINYTQVTTTAANATSYNATNLLSNTNYSWKVIAVKETASLPVAGSQSTMTGSLSGTKTVGQGGNYNNLTEAFAAINSEGLSGDITLQLITNYPTSPETYPIVSPGSIVGNFKVMVYPTVSGLSITSANTTGTFQFNGGINMTIDGRVNATGTTPNLIIENTATAGYAIQYINDAIGNTVKYCTIKGATTSTTSGVIFFSTTTGSNGNDNNLIDSCDIRDAATTPTNLVYASGTTTTTAQNNSGNTISNSNIYNFYNSTSTTNGGTGINISSGNTDWNITSNSFYQTTTRTAFGSGATVSALIISSSGNNFIITGNYIGGTASQAGSAAYTINSTATVIFRAIQASVGTTTASSLQGNIIQNIAVTTASTSTVQSLISLISGSFNCGNSTPNQIGSQSTQGNIIFTQSTSSTSPVFSAIVASSSSPALVVISGNTIGGITVANSSTGSISLRGLNISGSANYTISANVIGSTSTANSIMNSTNLSTYGIISASSGTAVSIANNTISNLTGSATGTSGFIHGIAVSSGANTITGNVIKNFTTSSTLASSSFSALGIYVTSTTANQVVSRNTIYSLFNTTGTTAVSMAGIVYSGASTGTNLVERNFVHSLSLSTTSATANIWGINITSGAATYQNNMVRLGIDSSGSSLSNSFIITGIEKAGTSANNFYFNTVYIGGQNVVTGAANTFAFKRSGTGIDDIRDNILQNERSNASSTGKHYSIGLNATTTITLNYNLYYGTGTGYMFGYIGAPGTTDYATLAAWKAANTSFDINSIYNNPALANPAGAASNVNLHLTITSPAESAGIVIPSVLNDFDGESRDALSPTDIGADAGNYGLPGTDVGVSALVSPIAVGCKTSTESVSVSLKNYSSNPIDLSSNNITVTVNVTGTVTYSSSVVVNTGIIASGQSVTVNLPTPLDMSANGTYVFNAMTTVTTGPADQNAANDAMQVVNRTVLSLGGNYNVGAGGDYTTISAAAAAYTQATCFSGNVVFKLTDATYTGETFPIVFGANSTGSSNSVIIKPAAGIAPVITGSNATALIDFNGGKYITIDGSNIINGTSKDLTVVNTNTSGSTLRFINDASNNYLMNCNIEGASTSTTAGVIFFGTGITTGNDNNVIFGNTIRDRSDAAGVPAYLIASTGTSTTVANSFNVISKNIIKNFSNTGIFTSSAQTGDNWTITSNDIFQEATRATAITGINLGGNMGTNLIAMNTIHDLVASGSVLVQGIFVGDCRTATVDRNYLYNFPSVLGATGGITAITFTGTTSVPSTCIVTNNMVSIVPAFTNNQQLKGILDFGFASNIFTAYNNSIYIGGTATGSSSTWALIRGIIASTAYTAKNNIAFNGRTGGTGNHFAAGDETANGGTYVSDYNIFIGTGATAANFMDYGTSSSSTPVSVTAWKAGPPARDANSLFSNPGVGNFTLAAIFVSANDLHTVTGSPAIGVGTPIAGMTHDFDSETRNAVTPDMGADEKSGTPPVYTFTGTGNWSIGANWKELMIPPPTLQSGSEIVIDPASGSCIQNIPMSIPAGGKLTVKANKNLIVPGNVIAQ